MSFEFRPFSETTDRTEDINALLRKAYLPLEKATRRVAMYERRGYRFIGYHQWSVTNYRSVVMSKTL